MTNYEIATLTNQLNEYVCQLDLLAAKQEAALSTANGFAQEIRKLRQNHLMTTKQLRDFLLHQSGMHQWENIGCGG